MLELILELFSPTGSGRLAERILRRANGDQIAVESWRRAAIKRALNESGWLGDEVIAAVSCDRGRRRR